MSLGEYRLPGDERVDTQLLRHLRVLFCIFCELICNIPGERWSLCTSNNLLMGRHYLPGFRFFSRLSAVRNADFH